MKYSEKKHKALRLLQDHGPVARKGGGIHHKTLDWMVSEELAEDEQIGSTNELGYRITKAGKALLAEWDGEDTEESATDRGSDSTGANDTQTDSQGVEEHAYSVKKHRALTVSKGGSSHGRLKFLLVHPKTIEWMLGHSLALSDTEQVVLTEAGEKLLEEWDRTHGGVGFSFTPKEEQDPSSGLMEIKRSLPQYVVDGLEELGMEAQRYTWTFDHGNVTIRPNKKLWINERNTTPFTILLLGYLGLLVDKVLKEKVQGYVSHYMYTWKEMTAAVIVFEDTEGNQAQEPHEFVSSALEAYLNVLAHYHD